MTQGKTPKAEAAPSCPLCEAPNAPVIRTGIRDDPDAPVFRCPNCSLQYLRRPTYDLHQYYRDAYRKNHANAIGSEVYTSKEQYDLLRPLMDARVAMFKEHVPKGSVVLEIGCSSGFFLDAIRDEYSVYGNEWNPEDAAYVRDELGIPCSEEPLEQAFTGQQFTAIVAYHVLEHVPDPVAWLRLIKSRLVGGGWIHFELPNVDQALLALYDIPDFEDFFYREPHLNYFNMQTLAGLLGVLGFEAQVRLRQEYSLANMFHWIDTGRPQPNRSVATKPLLPVPMKHPANGITNRWFSSVDRQYRNLMDTLKASDTLLAIGRKREI
jgi:2-polyprenyl-3-methyl-5-hydroxy-6-metoxy-1,4-benzoquinol methylase